MEAATAQQEQQQGREAEASKDPNHEAVKRVAANARHPEKNDPQDVKDATAWFLSNEDTGGISTKSFDLNVGLDRDHFVTWTVQAIEREKIREIRRMSRPARLRAQQGEVDEMAANLGIAAAGTIEPDLNAIAAQIGSQDSADVLRRRLAHKPGLIDQVAAEVLAVSGYDDDDIREVAAGKP